MYYWIYYQYYYFIIIIIIRSALIFRTAIPRLSFLGHKHNSLNDN